MSRSRIGELNQLGQSVWYDNIRRSELASGEMQRLIDLGITGLTSNPTIFEKAIGQSTDYDTALRELVADGCGTPSEIFEELATVDIQTAADLLRPIFDATNGADGFASYEVPPGLAHDTEGTIAEAHRLFARLDRPNVMIKVPATPEGMAAIERLTADGVNVNITLIFALDAYRKVMEAYVRGLETRFDGGQPLGRISSVASFFVSRIDSLADKLLMERLQVATRDEERAPLRALLGKAAIANAKLAYQACRAMFNSERFARLAERGARLQRPLWASTSTKNPEYPDTYYVDNLIAPNTVNTLPPATIRAFEDHGTLRVTIEEGLDEARGLFDRLAEAGVSIDDVTEQVLIEGIASFAKSFETMLQALDDKCTLLAAARKDAAKPAAKKPGTKEAGAPAAAAKKRGTRRSARSPLPAKTPTTRKPRAKTPPASKPAKKTTAKRPAARRPPAGKKP